MESMHVLENSWTLWFDQAASHKSAKSQKPWEESLTMVQVVTTVEEFWAMMGIIKKPTALTAGSTYHFFKTGVKPMWEDPANKNGGAWVVSLIESHDLYNMDSIWEEVLMSVIGEYLDGSDAADQVLGCVVARRKYFSRIQVWIKDKDDAAAVLALGEKLREILKVRAGLQFNVHNDSNAMPIKLEPFYTAPKDDEEIEAPVADPAAAAPAAAPEAVAAAPAEAS